MIYCPMFLSYFKLYIIFILENANCSNIVCPAGKTCLTDPRNGRPVCYACNRHCEHVPSVRVCGTNNRTYENYCKLGASACKQGIYIKALHAGSCKCKLLAFLEHSFLILSFYYFCWQYVEIRQDVIWRWKLFTGS